MGFVLIGFVLGALVGAVTGTGLGIFAGGVAGVFLGGMLYGLSWLRRHAGDSPTVERHCVMCERFGQHADCELVGDLGTKRWYDVESCSLQPTGVDCHKGCLSLMTAAGVRPGSPSHA